LKHFLLYYPTTWSEEILSTLLNNSKWRMNNRLVIALDNPYKKIEDILLENYFKSIFKIKDHSTFFLFTCLFWIFLQPHCDRIASIFLDKILGFIWNSWHATSPANKKSFQREIIKIMMASSFKSGFSFWLFVRNLN